MDNKQQIPTWLKELNQRRNNVASAIQTPTIEQPTERPQTNVPDWLVDLNRKAGEAVKPTPQLKQAESPLKQFARKAFAEPFNEFMAGVSGATANTAHILDILATKISDVTGMPKGGLFKNIATEYNKQYKRFKSKGIKDTDAASNAVRTLYEGLGSAAFEIPKYIASGPGALPVWGGLGGAAKAIRGKKPILPETAKGILSGLALKTGLHGAAYLPRGLGEATGGAIFGGPAIVEELKKPPEQRNWGRVVGETLVGIGLTMQGKRIPWSAFIERERDSFRPFNAMPKWEKKFYAPILKAVKEKNPAIYKQIMKMPAEDRSKTLRGFWDKIYEIGHAKARAKAERVKPVKYQAQPEAQQKADQFFKLLTSKPEVFYQPGEKVKLLGPRVFPMPEVSETGIQRGRAELEKAGNIAKKVGEEEKLRKKSRIVRVTPNPKPIPELLANKPKVFYQKGEKVKLLGPRVLITPEVSKVTGKIATKTGKPKVVRIVPTVKQAEVKPEIKPIKRTKKSRKNYPSQKEVTYRTLVKRYGGLNSKGDLAGEVKRLPLYLKNRKGFTLDRMTEKLQQAGYPVRDFNDLIDKLNSNEVVPDYVTGEEKTPEQAFEEEMQARAPEAEDFAKYHPQEMTVKEIASKGIGAKLKIRGKPYTVTQDAKGRTVLIDDVEQIFESDKTTVPVDRGEITPPKAAKAIRVMKPKILTKKSKGKIFYHGTNQLFDKFEKGAGSGSGAGTFGAGVFLTADKETANWWAKYASLEGGVPNTKKVFADIKNTKVFTTRKTFDNFVEKFDNPNKVVEYLKKQGYDSISYPENIAETFGTGYFDKLSKSLGKSFEPLHKTIRVTQVFDPQKVHILTETTEKGTKQINTLEGIYKKSASKEKEFQSKFGGLINKAQKASNVNKFNESLTFNERADLFNALQGKEIKNVNSIRDFYNQAKRVKETKPAITQPKAIRMVKSTKPIPKELSPLVKQAKKYESAEKFHSAVKSGEVSRMLGYPLYSYPVITSKLLENGFKSYTDFYNQAVKQAKPEKAIPTEKVPGAKHPQIVSKELLGQAKMPKGKIKKVVIKPITGREGVGLFKREEPKTGELFKKAKKYKSAKEFVNSKATLYHGSDVNIDKFDMSKVKKWNKFGHFFSPDREAVKIYGDKITQAEVTVKNPKTITQKQWWDIRGEHAKDDVWFSNWKKELKKQGYDGLLIKGSTEQFAGQKVKNPEILVAFDDSQVKTKSQLIDIWNKAHKAKPKRKPIPKKLEPSAKKLAGKELWQITKKEFLPTYEPTGEATPTEGVAESRRIRRLREKNLERLQDGTKITVGKHTYKKTTIAGDLIFLNEKGEGIPASYIAELDLPLEDIHKQSVKQALKEGKPVPPEVLKDYPDLAKKYIKTIEKQPWEMTKEEFVSNPPPQVDIFLVKNEPPLKGKIGQTTDILGGTTKGYRVVNTVTPFDVAHKDIVEDALSKGKPVPPEVLKDYPELVKNKPIVKKLKKTGKRIGVGDKFIIEKSNTPIEIVKDYGMETPKEDYPQLWRMDLSGYVEVKDMETGEKFPATRNELRKAGLSEYIKPETVKPTKNKSKVKPVPKAKIALKGVKIAPKPISFYDKQQKLRTGTLIKRTDKGAWVKYGGHRRFVPEGKLREKPAVVKIKKPLALSKLPLNEIKLKDLKVGDRYIDAEKGIPFVVTGKNTEKGTVDVQDGGQHTFKGVVIRKIRGRVNGPETTFSGMQIHPKQLRIVRRKIEPSEVPIKALSGFKNFIDLKKIKTKKIPFQNMDIAGIVRGNKVYAAIRKSGFYATKEIQTAPIRDIYRQSEAPYHMALMQDGYKRGGKFGAIFRNIWLPTEKAVRNEKEFVAVQAKAIRDLAKEHKIKTTGKNLKHLSDVMENKVEATPQEELFVKDLRSKLDHLRDQANYVRELMGRKLIGYIEDYIPHLQKVSLWNQLLSNEATISDNLSFIVPNQVKNPFAYKRMMEEMPKAERNLFVLLDRYVKAIAKDIYITPAIENIKAYNRVLKSREKINAAKYWDEYIRTGLVGKQHKLDTALSIGFKGRRELQKWNHMVNLAFLTGKVAWNVATQPLSYIMNVPMETGIRNSIRGIYKSFFNRPLRKFVRKNSNVLSIKSSDVQAVAVGEGRNIQNRIYRTKIDKYNHFLSMLGAIEERELTLASYIAGLEKAKRLGYKGKDALTFADLTAARTQSMYNKENRALILNSDIARTIFPFQSFSIEMFNHLKEITTKARGAESLSYRQRFGKLFGMLVGIYLAQLYSKALTGRKKTTVGTFVPFAGNYVDYLVAKAQGKEYYGGRSPITVVQVSEDIIRGARDYVKYGSLRRLRKVALNFGLALGGIGGGGQINNIIDGLIADVNEDVKNVKGETMFEVKDAESKVKAPIFGVWATKEGRAYWKPKEEKTPKGPKGRIRIVRKERKPIQRKERKAIGE